MHRLITTSDVHQPAYSVIMYGKHAIMYHKQDDAFNARRLCLENGLEYSDWPMLQWLRKSVPEFKEKTHRSKGDKNGVYLPSSFLFLLLLWIEPTNISKWGTSYNDRMVEEMYKMVTTEFEQLTKTIVEQSLNDIHATCRINLSLRHLINDKKKTPTPCTNNSSKKELMDYCRKHNIRGYSRLDRTDLETLVRNHQSS